MTTTIRWWRGIAAGALCSAAPAQAVINEVLYDPAGPDAGQEIIELANPGAAAVSLTGWSLCIGYSNAFARTYWDFPAGTTIPAGGFLQVRWLTGGASSATVLFTGTAAGNFTCFQPAQLLDNDVGSVALYSDQSCFGFGLSGNIADFVQWGGGPTFRASVAVAAGIWPSTSAAAADVPDGHSLAFDGAGDDPLDWFDDLCPTPGAANTGPGNPSLVSFGAGCTGAAGTPSFVTAGGPPALGNQSLVLGVQSAPAGAPAALFLGTQTSVPIFGCTLLSLPVVGLPVFAGLNVPFPIPCNPNLIGAQLALQWIVLDAGGPQGLSMSDGLLMGF